MTVRITEQELIEALAAAMTSTAPGDAKTTAELVEETGIGITRLRTALNRLKAAGRLGEHRIARERLGGGIAYVPAFTIKPEHPEP